MTAILIGFVIYAETMLLGVGGLNAADKHIERNGPFPPPMVMAKGFEYQRQQNESARKIFFSKYEKVNGRWILKVVKP